VAAKTISNWLGQSRQVAEMAEAAPLPSEAELERHS
jgi:hypothetical protein